MSCIFNHATKSSSIFARDSICYRPSVRPSVCLSTRVDQSKTAEDSMMQFTAQYSQSI